MNTRHRNSNAQLNIRALLRRGIHFMYLRLIESASTNEDIRRHEFILNTILSCTIGLLTVLDVYIAIATIKWGSLYHGIPFTYFTFVIIIFIYLFILSRKGYHRVSSFLLLLLYFIGTTFGAVEWSIWLPFIGISYVLIIVFASILISTRFSIYVTLLNIFTICFVSYLQIKGYIHVNLEWKHSWISMHEPIQLSFVLFVITAASWLSNREMEHSLQRARISEQALLEERNLLEIKVEERTAELKELQKEKIAQLYRFAEFGKLSTGVFHDLMNSLHSVANNVERLSMSETNVPEIKEHIIKAVSASKRMGNYIETVRKQISNKEIVAVFSPAKEIADAIDIVHFKAREANVQITTQTTTETLLHGNAIKFYQAVSNILMNAIEACEEYGNDQSLIIVTQISTPTHIVITIRDNGCGMDPLTQEQVFDAFFTTKIYGKGTGFGLSQTKEIIEKEFGGTITVHSVKDIGTIFTITLPIREYNKTDSPDNQ